MHEVWDHRASVDQDHVRHVRANDQHWTCEREGGGTSARTVPSCATMSARRTQTLYVSHRACSRLGSRIPARVTYRWVAGRLGFGGRVASTRPRRQCVRQTRRGRW